jgi:transmembrane sensor
VNAARPEHRHLAAAAEWLVRLGEQDAAVQAEWRVWYDAAPEHRAAWQKVEQLQGLLAAAPLQTRSALHKAGQGSRRRLMAVCGVVFVAGALLMALPTGPAAVPVEWISTAAGERRSLQLPDGGSLLLGVNSRVGIAYGPHAREIHIAAGAIRLISGHDAQGRPLRLLARDGVIQPLGTRFSFKQDERFSVLSVQEHAVEVSGPQAQAAIRVEAGQRLVFSRTAMGRPEAAQWSDDAWTRGVLVALNTPLRQFVAQLSAQSGQRIDCDPRLADLRVSGAYRVDALESSLSTLAEAQSLRIEKQSGSWHLKPR